MEINPQSNVVPDYSSATYTPCNPGPNQNDVNNKWQTSWNGMQYKLDPYQQLFNKQFGGIQELNVSDFYTIEIIENAQYADIVKLGYYDPESGEMIDSIHIGDLLENVSGLELTGTGDWEYTICGTKEKEFNSKYVVNFSRDVPQNTVVTIMLTDLTTGDTKYFHTRIAVPTMNFDDPVSEDTLGILHYYSVELPITLSSDENWCSSCGGSIPGWVTFTIEITNGQQYGNLYNKTTGERASSFTNIIANQNWSCGNSITDYDFIADGVQPDSLIPAVVKVRCTSSDGEIGVWERNIYISYNDVEPVEEGIIISFSKDHLAPGDTAEIILQRQNTDGSVADFTEWDSFEIGIIEGCGGGKIMAGDSLDSYFSEAYLPIYFVADSTLTDTSITVGIRAGLIEGIIGASRMQNNNGQQEKKSDYKKNKRTVSKPVNKTNTQNLPQNNPAASCFGGTIERNIDGNGNLVVGIDCGAGAPVCSTEVQVPLGFKEEVVEWTGNYIFHKEGYYPETLEISSGGMTYFLRDGEFKLIPINAPSKDKKYAIPLSGSFYDPYEIETCFNKNLNNGKGGYQYNFKSIGETDNFIHKPIIIQVADYTNDPYAMKSLNDLNSIPSEKICSALIDFEYERYRKAEQDNDDFFNTHEPLYNIIESYWEHEKYHKRDAMRFLNEKFNSEPIKVNKPDGSISLKTLKNHLQTTFSCSQQIKNFDDAKREGEKYIEDALRKFEKFFTEHWHVILIEIYHGEQWKLYILEELWAQWSDSVQNKISRYQTSLASRPGYDPSQCEAELNKIKKFWDPFNIYRNNR